MADEAARAAAQLREDVAVVDARSERSVGRSAAGESAHALIARIGAENTVHVVLHLPVVDACGHLTAGSHGHDAAAASRRSAQGAVVGAFGQGRGLHVTDDAALMESRIGAVARVGDRAAGQRTVVDAVRQRRVLEISGDAAQTYRDVGGVAARECDRGLIGAGGDFAFGIADESADRRTLRSRARQTDDAFDGEVLDFAVGAEGREETVGDVAVRKVEGPIDVLQREVLAVEHFIKDIFTHCIGDSLVRIGGAGSYDSADHIIAPVRTRHVDVVHQADFAVDRIFGQTLAGIDRRGESLEVVGVADARRRALHRRKNQRLDNHVVRAVVEHHDQTALLEAVGEGHGNGFGLFIEFGRESFGLLDGQHRSFGLAHERIGDHERLRDVGHHGPGFDAQQHIEAVLHLRRDLHAVAQREDHRAVVLHFDLGDHRSALALGLHRIARRVGYPLAEERPVALIVYADFGRTARNGNFGTVDIEQPRGLAARGDGPIVDFAVGLHADDRLGIGVVHGRDVDRVLHVVGILVAEDIVPVGILRDRGDGTAADDCGQRVELLLHRRDLSLEFVEALVHPVDVLPQGRIVEVVAASVSENGRSGEHQSQDSFHSF